MSDGSRYRESGLALEEALVEYGPPADVDEYKAFCERGLTAVPPPVGGYGSIDPQVRDADWQHAFACRNRLEKSLSDKLRRGDPILRGRRYFNGPQVTVDPADVGLLTLNYRESRALVGGVVVYWDLAVYPKDGKAGTQISVARPSEPDVRRAVQRYVESEQVAGKSTSIKRATVSVKQTLPRATRKQVEAHLRVIEGGAKPRGKPVQKVPAR
ncbi:MAG: hypothetical protein ACHQRJ_13435 [Alphaproteobacteria bacterium]